MSRISSSRWWRRVGTLVSGGATLFSGCVAYVDMPSGYVDISPEGVFVDLPGVSVNVTAGALAIDTPAVDVDIRGDSGCGV